MKRKFLVIIALVYITSAQGASLFDSISISKKPFLGFSVGITQQNAFMPSVYGGTKIFIQNYHFEALLSYAYFNNKSTFINHFDVEFNSHGLFCEVDYYFRKNCFLGVKYGSTFNWVTPQSQLSFSQIPNLTPPMFFGGNLFSSKIGYILPINQSIGLKAQAELGLHNYSLVEGWEISTSNTPNPYQQNTKVVNHIDLLYNLNVGMYFQL